MLASVCPSDTRTDLITRILIQELHRTEKLHLDRNAPGWCNRRFDLKEFRKGKGITSSLRTVILSRVLQKEMSTLLEWPRMERKVLGQGLEENIIGLKHQIHVNLV